MSGEVLLYQRHDGALYACGFSRDRAGRLVVNGWYAVISSDAPDDEVGAAVQEGLRLGEEPVDVAAEDSQELLEPLLKAAGVRNFTAFTRDARAVGAGRSDSGAYYFIPMRNPNRARENGLLDMDEELTLRSGASTGEIGRTAREGLGRSLVE